WRRRLRIWMRLCLRTMMTMMMMMGTLRMTTRTTMTWTPLSWRGWRPSCSRGPRWR
ncbi:hypothetical protein MNEG_8537, partial [Monoraphidium neglectum]